MRRGRAPGLWPYLIPAVKDVKETGERWEAAEERPGSAADASPSYTPGPVTLPPALPEGVFENAKLAGR